MKLASVDRALKELQNDTPFSTKLFSTGVIPSKNSLHVILKYRYRFFKHLYLQQYKTQPNEKGII